MADRLDVVYKGQVSVNCELESYYDPLMLLPLSKIPGFSRTAILL